MTAEVFFADEQVNVWHGDNLKVLAAMADASVDAVIGDPPYALEFMSHDWDTFGGGPAGFQSWCEVWARECLRVLKPGGHMLMFGGSRTWHRLACAVEDAGFEIRDSIAWLYGQGMPKSLNLKGDWKGWGTTLKPAFEPIVVARKPLAGTVAATVAEFRTGALHIDACRVGDGSESKSRDGERSRESRYKTRGATDFGMAPGVRVGENGRWPTNVVLDDAMAEGLDEQSGVLKSGANPIRRNSDKFSSTFSPYVGRKELVAARGADSGGASRFFPVFRWQAKASAKERPVVDGVRHPTPKPLALMRWLVRLVTPAGGLVLDPFAGSGTTVEACLLEGMRCVAVEQMADYLPLIQARINRVVAPLSA